MNNKLCPICSNSFYGRSNQIYCNKRCRSEQGNAVFTANHAAEISTEKALRKNVKILATLYKFFGSDCRIPYYSLKNADFDMDVNTGFTRNSESLYHNYALKMIETDSFKISKI